MNKKLWILIAICFLVSIGTIVLLYQLSSVIKKTPGSFVRTFPPHPVMEGDTLNIRYNSYYIAGGTDHSVYLGNYKAPLHLLKVNLKRLDTQYIKLNIEGIEHFKFWSAKVRVDSPYFYLTDGAVPLLFKGNMLDWKGERILNDTLFFREIVPKNDGSFFLKSISSVTGENTLGKMHTLPFRVTFKPGILKKQLDGIFCTDGSLHFNKELNKLVYLYYYRNQFIVMDTTVSVLHEGRTIDTTSKAMIKVASLKNESQSVLASPPLMVNKKSCVSGRWLFVNSNLLAKNETAQAFQQGAVIDVYDLLRNRYEFSFYIYNYWGANRMTDFKVFDRKMVVLYNRSIRVFELSPRHFIKDDLPSSLH